jgi:hypothetical protein
MTGGLPTLPTQLTVIELNENHSGRSCTGCGARAELYCLVTNERANDALGADLPADAWPVNAMLCRDCFRMAPRVGSLADHPDVPDDTPTPA